jgi:hypothetical protein
MDRLACLQDFDHSLGKSANCQTTPRQLFGSETIKVRIGFACQTVPVSPK